MCDFSDLLQQYANTLPSKQLMFRVSKKCGYSQLVMLQRIPNSNQVTVSDLLHTIQEDMGDYTVGKIYYYPKSATTPAATNMATPANKLWLHTYKGGGVGGIRGANVSERRPWSPTEPLDQFALNHLPTAYSIEECKYAVYQLYVDLDCHERAGCSCSQDPPPMITDNLAMMIDDDEPTREELLSMFYDTNSLSPSPSPSPSNLPMPPVWDAAVSERK